MSAGRLWRASIGLTIAMLACTSTGEAPRVSARVAEVHRLGVLASRGEGVNVKLPETADANVTLSGALEVRFALRSARGVPGREEDGVTVYPGALGGADVVHARIPDGVEDLVFFDDAPSEESVAYDVDVSHVAGLRLVSSSLELLDAGGAPRVRVMRPWILGKDGARADLDLAVEGCAVDRDPRAPWGRPTTPPGARSCVVRIDWRGRGVAYPAVLDPAWTLGGAPRPRYGHGTFTFASGRVLAMQGWYSAPGTSGNGLIFDGDVYDPATNTWAGGISTPGGRQDFELALLPSGKALVVGGGGNSRAEIVTDQATVTRSQDFNSPSFGTGNTATALVSGKVLVLGGLGGSPSSAYLYDEPTDLWSPAGTTKAVRAYHTATRLPSGKVLLAGGEGAAGTSAELYDPAAGTFTLVPTPMIASRSRHTASLLADGKVLLAGGGVASAELYDPATNAFTEAGAMPAARSTARAVVLLSGDVMIAGGEIGGAPTGDVQIWDHVTKAFSAQPNLLFPRTKLGAARLPGGEVFLFGGRGTTGYSLGTSEIWRPGAAGTTCTTGDDCRSGACEEGICCAAACPGACQTCAPSTGACLAVTKADDPNSCTGDNTCDAAGACRKKNGKTCELGSQCASGSCVDGVCCDRACDGQCEACDVTGQRGTCSPVAGPPRGGRPACVAEGTTCGGTCSGLDGKACAYPSAITSCGATCAGAEITTSTCDGKGGCFAEAARGCPGNFVCESAGACKTSCASTSECATGYACETGRCLPIALCEERYVTKGTTKVDCFPYTCEQSGVCKTSCASVSDCVAPTVCGLDGTCIDPPVPPDGCAVTPGSSRPTGAAVLLFALAALATRHTRTRTRRSA